MGDDWLATYQRNNVSDETFVETVRQAFVQADSHSPLVTARRDTLYRSKTRRRSVTCGGLSSGSGRSVVFVDHTAEYAMASDQAVDGQGGWSVLVVGGSLVESLVRPVRVVLR